MLINSPNISGSLTVTGNIVATGSLTVGGTITGTVSGTATSASYASNAELLDGKDSSIFATTGSNQFNGNQAITGSLTTTGQIVAQTLNVQQVTSSIVYSSGSNIFGNSVANTQQFTGSLQVSGSSHYLFGNVGIGTDNPNSGKLTILGTNYVVANSGKALGGLDLLTTSSPGAGGYGAAISFAANGTGRAAIAAVQGTSDNDNQGLAFFTHGSTGASDSVERLRITSDGNVGIGTTAPAQKLHVSTGVDADAGLIGILLGGTVANSRQALIEKQTSGTRQLSIYSSLSNSVFFPISFYTGVGAAKLTILEGGNVGIGTDTPTNGLLHLYKNATIGAITSPNVTNSTLRIQDSGFSMYLDGNSIVMSGTGYISNNGAYSLSFGTNNTERLQITSDGNILIGGTVVQNSTANRGNLTINGTTSILNLSISNTNGGYLYHNGSDMLLVNVKDGGLLFRTNNTERMRIDSNGRVGIGVTPNNHHTTLIKTLQVGTRANLFTYNNSTTDLANNLYFDNSLVEYTYIQSAPATFFRQNNGKHSFYTAPSGTAGTAMSLSLKAEIDSDGLKFNGDTAAANALDDYEEGTWTPQIIRHDGTIPASFSISTGTATYVKIGRLVFLKCFITNLQDGSSNGSSYWRINGVPFAGTRYAATKLAYSNMPSDGAYIGDAAGNLILTNNNAPYYGSFGTSKEFMLTLCYETNS